MGEILTILAFYLLTIFGSCIFIVFLKYDWKLKLFRKTIPEEEQSEIWGEVYNQLHQLQLARKKMSRKRTFTSPKTQLG